MVVVVECRSEFTESFEDAAGFGWHPPASGHDAKTLIARKVKTFGDFMTLHGPRT